MNYHHRNVGPEPITAENLRYTSCEGCDWLGGHRDEAGWEGHIAAILTAVPVGVDVEPHEHDAVCMCPTCSSERATYCALTRGADNHQDHQIPTCPKRVISPGSASAPDGA